MAGRLRGQLVGFACSRRPERSPGGEQLREKHRFTCGSKPSRAAHPLNSRAAKGVAHWGTTYIWCFEAWLASYFSRRLD